MTLPDFGKLLKLVGTILNEEERLKAISLITDMQQTLSTLQTENFQLKEQIFSLKDQIRDYEDWNKAKEQYTLVQNPSGASLFVHKTTKVKACPTCMGKKLESILQPGAPGYWGCHNCNLFIEWEPQPTPRYDPPGNPWSRPFSPPH